MKLRVLITCLFAAFSETCLADSSRTEFEQGFIGIEWTVPYFPSDRCEYLGGSLPTDNDELTIDSLLCDGRRLQLFGRVVAPGRTKVLDAVLLPTFGKGDDLMIVGECELRKKTDRFFFALVNLGKRKSANWKTGVKAAWYPNPAIGKFEALPTRDIVCYAPTPP